MPRLTAWQVLRSGTSTPLRAVDRAAERAGLDDRDRSLARRLIGTEVRQRGALRALVAHFARGKPSADVAAHLRLGLAQLFYLDRVPPHAAVSETVRAVADSLGLSKARAANAVLRSAQRARLQGHCGDPRRDLVGRPWHVAEPVFHDPAQHPLLWIEDALSLPAQIAKRWSKRLGDETTRRLATEALEEPPLSLVVLAGERADVAAELAEACGGAAALRPAAGDGVLLAPASATEAIVRSAPFVEGRITVQGETAWRAAALLSAAPGERALDLCAAPGGKGALLARAGAEVVSLDLSARRLARLPEGFARLAPQARPRLAACDGTRALAADARFDAVLLDAPCTNTGVLAARPGAKWRFGPQTLRDLVELQARLLREAAARVRDGGRLVYSTCSIEPEEGERLVRAFLSEVGGSWRCIEERTALPDPASGGPIDGGYAALLRR